MALPVLLPTLWLDAACFVVCSRVPEQSSRFFLCMLLLTISVVLVHIVAHYFGASGAYLCSLYLLVLLQVVSHDLRGFCCMLLLMAAAGSWLAHKGGGVAGLRPYVVPLSGTAASATLSTCRFFNERTYILLIRSIYLLHIERITYWGKLRIAYLLGALTYWKELTYYLLTGRIYLILTGRIYLILIGRIYLLEGTYVLFTYRENLLKSCVVGFQDCAYATYSAKILLGVKHSWKCECTRHVPIGCKQGSMSLGCWERSPLFADVAAESCCSFRIAPYTL